MKNDVTVILQPDDAKAIKWALDVFDVARTMENAPKDLQRLMTKHRAHRLALMHYTIREHGKPRAASVRPRRPMATKYNKDGSVRGRIGRPPKKH